MGSYLETGKMKNLIHRKIIKAGILLVLFTASQSNIFPQALEFKGLFSGWITGNSKNTSIGLRYIPDFFIKKSISKKYTFDVEFSLNAYGTGRVHSIDNIEKDCKIKPYRLWLRFSGSQFEVRIGLQKINFGSAALLRPLMWFDRIDPRDPLQITDGVYGLLFRYYFLNNANIWFWGLYGNGKEKGWEVIPSNDRSIEYGGRLQIPLFTGEIAFTYHHRKMDLSQMLLTQITGYNNNPPENRIALDGKWDIGVGFWFEGSMIHQQCKALPFEWRRSLNIGLDYTFGVGNGIHIMGEHFVLENTKTAFGSGEKHRFTALSLRYPVGLLDNITSIFYYDWKNKELYRFINWQRTYDRWSFHVIGFWNPVQFQIYQYQKDNNLFAGKGFQIMVVFNH